MASKMLLSLVKTALCAATYKEVKFDDIETDAQVLPLVACQYTPDWPSIDSRPLPAWYDEAKVTPF